MKKKLCIFLLVKILQKKNLQIKKCVNFFSGEFFLGVNLFWVIFFQVFSNSKKNYNGIQNKIIYNSVNGDNITSVFHDGKQSWGVCDITV